MATLLFPLFVLGYSLAHFHLDIKALALRNQYMTPGTFSGIAQYFADPVVISQFKAGFDSLRLFSWTALIVRFGQNLLFCGRVLFLVDSSKQALEKGPAMQTAFDRQRRVPKWVGWVALAYMPLLVAYSIATVHQATAACAKVAGCQRFGYLFVLTQQSSCPCIDFVDRQPNVLTYAEWAAPLDVTDALRNVAEPGKLMTVALVNRKLTELPETLQHCDNLREL